jgi:hypothetical protein
MFAYLGNIYLLFNGTRRFITEPISLQDTFVSQLNPVHTLTPNLLETKFNII